MSLKGKHALVTGGSRGIGRGIALKLAEAGARIAIHYYVNEAAAKETLEHVRKHGADGFLVQADVSRVDDVRRMFAQVKQQLGSLDVFVANARPELAKFYQKPLEISLEAWDQAVDSQAKAFLVGVQQAVPMMGAGGRIVAITYAPGAQKGTWQPWVAMGSAKAAMESLVRYFAGAARDHRELREPRADRRQRLQWPALAGPADRPRLARERLDADGAYGHSGRYRQRSGAA